MGPEVYPVLAAVAGGCAFAGWFGTRTLSTHNDIVLNKKKQFQITDSVTPHMMKRENVMKKRDRIINKYPDLYRQEVDKAYGPWRSSACAGAPTSPGASSSSSSSTAGRAASS